MIVKLTQSMKDFLISRGIETFHTVNVTNISEHAVFDPPCGIKWIQIENRFRMGAFSYAVSGFFSEVNIGRYTSIGEQVQIGRSNHALTWVSTSPFFYLRESVFNIGNSFAASEAYHAYCAPLRPGAPATEFKQVEIGNDVWIGHGALIMPGVKIGDGAVIGAMSVLTRDVPPYGIVAGNPAVLRRMRLAPDLVANFLRLRWWRFAPWQLEDVDFTCPHKAVDQLEQIVLQKRPYQPEAVEVANLPR